MCTSGEIRLSGSNFDRHGRVEVCLNGNWGTICNNSVDNTDTSVICRQLGFSPYGESDVMISCVMIYVRSVGILHCFFLFVIILLKIIHVEGGGGLV